MKFITRWTIASFEIELLNSCVISDKKSGLSNNFFAPPVKISPNFDSVEGISVTNPSYVSGVGTGTAFGPISVVPSARLIQWGSRKGNSGCLATE